ncbi:MAG: FISUMP domain-containing protein [Candidatus Paceibacterota bacterium]|jgi:uncharacterized protein (TIGR02145 family)
MTKKQYLYSNLFAWGLVLLLITKYVYGWTIPSQNPPGGNIVLETGATPAGSTGYIQFNDNGNLGADSNLFWDNTNKYLGVGTANPGAKLEVNGNIITSAPTADNHVVTKSYVDSNFTKVDSVSATNLAVGWYTIAVNSGNRAIARFGLRDTASGRHQSIIFYASHHYGSSSELTVIHNGRYGSLAPYKYIRIKEGSTYDGALLQVYLSNSTNNLVAYLLGDNIQDHGWVLKNFIPDGTDPGGVGNFSALTNVAVQVDIEEILNGGMYTSGNIVASAPIADNHVATKAYVDSVVVLDDFTCGDNVTFVYNGKRVTYGTIESQGKCWMDRNLGALRVATAYDDSLAYGDLFQWGRLDDGHQIRTRGTTSTLSSTDDPGHSNFITNGSSPYDWRSSRNDNLWQGVSGTNNPCPSGWRIPTSAEWQNEYASWSQQNYSGAFASPLKLTAGGSRAQTGTIQKVGLECNYWTSTRDGSYSKRLVVSSSAVNLYGRQRATSGSVRCLKD